MSKKRYIGNEGHGRATNALLVARQLTVVFEDGVSATASLVAMGVPLTPAITAVAVDHMGYGVILRRGSNERDSVSTGAVLKVNTPGDDAGADATARELLKANIASNLRSAREAAGRTQKWMAEQLKIAVPNYSRLESGRHMADLGVLVKAASALRISLDALLRDRSAAEVVAEAMLPMSMLAPGSTLVIKRRSGLELEPPAGVEIRYLQDATRPEKKPRAAKHGQQSSR